MTAPRWNVPAAWQWTSIDEIAEIIGGGTPPAGEPNNFVNDGIPWITPADLARNRSTYVTGGSRSLSQEGYANSGARLLPKGAVLFSSRAPIGYCAIASNPICTNQGFKSLVLRENLLPEYVRHYLLASKDYAESEASGTTFLELSGARMRTLALPVAPIAEQQRIVAKIEELTARSRRAKEALDAVPPLLDQLRQSILAAAFRGDLTADWRHANATKGWSSYQFEEILDQRAMRTGPFGTLLSKIDHRSSGVPVLGIENIGGMRFVPGNKLFVDEIKADLLREYEAREGDLIVSRSGTVGEVCVVPPGLGRVIISTNIIRVTVDRNIVDPAFLGYCLVGSEAVLQQIRERCAGTTRVFLNQGIMSSLTVPVPSIMEQQLIVELLDSALCKVEKFARELRVLAEQHELLNKSILAKAFRGELVPQDPTDEPASVLLDRIRAARTTEPPTKRPRKTKSPALPEPKPASKPIRVPTQPQLLLDPHTLQEQVVSALWPLGPLDKGTAIRKAAESLRTAGYVDFQRLRADGPLYTQILAAIRSALKTGQLDRPTRGYVRACKPDALAYTPDDWRHALVASLGPEPIDREQAIRNAAQWARKQLGLEFSRLRADGHIAEGLRSAITSAIRRGEIIGHAKRISRPA